MSLTTYDGLIAAIPAWASYTDVTSYLDDFIAWAHQEINRRLRANVMLDLATATLDGETVAQPAGFLSLKRMSLDTVPRRHVIPTTATEVLTLLVERDQVQYPTHVAKEGSALRFAPTFTGSPEAEILYFKEVTVPSSTNATNAVMTAFPYLYLYGTLEALYSFKEDDNNADRYGQKFGALIEDINNRDGDDATGGPVARRVKGFA